MILSVGEKNIVDGFIILIVVIIFLNSILIHESCHCWALPLSSSRMKSIRIESSRPHLPFIKRSYDTSNRYIHTIFQRVSTSVTKNNPSPNDCDQYQQKIALFARPDGRDVEFITQNNSCTGSFVKRIHSFNIGGIQNYDKDDKTVVIDLGDVPQLVAVTGETGSGKSLLLAHVINLVVKGITAKSSIVSPNLPYNNNQTNQDYFPSQIMEHQLLASCQIDIQLGEPHKSFVLEKLEKLGLHVSSKMISENGLMILKRIFIRRDGKYKNRWISKYFINDEIVPSKVMKAIATPLITTVDATTAAASLSKPQSRLNIIDSGVDSQLLQKVRTTQKAYRKAKKERQEVSQKIQEYHDSLPSSYFNGGVLDKGDQENDKRKELLQHWIQELDQYESRIHKFQQQLELITSYTNPNPKSKEKLQDITQKVLSQSWMVDCNSNDHAKSSELYYELIGLREWIKAVDVQIQAAHSAVDILSSRSSSLSVLTLLDQTRKLLFDASGRHDENQDNVIQKSAEKSHELLNQLEDTLSKCVKSIENESNGMITELYRMRDSMTGVITLEDMDLLIGDWGALARKHGVTPDMLPSCHQSLRRELDGNEDIMVQLLDAKKKEQSLLYRYEKDCQLLTSARANVANALTESVSERLPYLGMEGTLFQVKLSTTDIDDTESSTVERYSDFSKLGVDTVDFLLLHQQGAIDDSTPKANCNQKETFSQGNFESPATTTNHLFGCKGGKLEIVGSSGEKARILLAIETDLPGSIGEICKSNNYFDSSLDTALNNRLESDDDILRPIAMIYDEIDAHVGGQAAVSVAKLLSDQTRGKKSVYFETNSIIRSSNKEQQKQVIPRKSQIICITHSPSIAAIADHHLVVQKSKNNLLVQPEKNSINMLTQVKIQNVDSVARTKEIARMASGDLAMKEAEIFAEALLRDGVLHVTKTSLDDANLS